MHRQSSSHGISIPLTAAGPAMGRTLLAHLALENTTTYGIAIQGDAVIDTGHTLYLNVERQPASTWRRFRRPLRRATGGDAWRLLV
jgi:hypothetical protein